MTILHDPKLISSLRNKWLFLDTNTFIAALNYSDPVGKFLLDLKANHCSFITIPSVLFEFTRGAETVDAFEKRGAYIQAFATIYPIEKHIDRLKEFIVVYQRVCSHASYTDFLLGACLYQFPEAFLLTENHKHFPVDLYDRKFVITFDADRDLRNHAIYTLSAEKFAKAAEKILKKELTSSMGNAEVDEIPF